LTDDKRFDEIINAFRNHPDKRLVIGGSGPQEADLKSLATDMDNVEFRGYLDESEKRELLASATALVYAAVNEDFGMVPIESYASGTPVIGVRDGYTKYQIRDGVTGILYDRGVQSLAEAIERFDSEGVDADASDLVNVAEKYSLEQFRDSIRDKVEKAVKDAAINAEPDI
jgi:glycosyltransferase involved in cell wall biosynthesis